MWHKVTIRDMREIENDDKNKIQNVFDYLLLEYDYAHINKIDGVKFDF